MTIYACLSQRNQFQNTETNANRGCYTETNSQNPSKAQKFQFDDIYDSDEAISRSKHTQFPIFVTDADFPLREDSFRNINTSLNANLPTNYSRDRSMTVQMKLNKIIQFLPVSHF